MEDHPQESKQPNPPDWDDDFAKNGAVIDSVFYPTREKAVEAYWRRRELRLAGLRRERESWEQSPAGKLCLDLYRKFQEYKAYLEQDSLAALIARGSDYPEDKLFHAVLRLAEQSERERREKDLQNLTRARNAARCAHLHADGRRCGSPRMKGKKLCYTHERMEEARAVTLDLGLMEDPESIQLAIMKLQRAVIEGTVSEKQTGRLAYLIQLAAWNVTHIKSANRGDEEE